MAYGNDLLAAATACAGSMYKLSQITGLQESHLSEASRGVRRVPVSWVYRLATVAGVEPGTALQCFEAQCDHFPTCPIVVQAAR